MSNHSPLLPPSAVLQQLVLTLVVTHTREDPGPLELALPISVMSIVSSGRHTLPFKVKYKPLLGGAARNSDNNHTGFNNIYI